MWPMPDKFRTVVTALVTRGDEFLIGKKEAAENHPIGGQWHILGGHLEHGEELEKAVKREVKEETGLESEVRELVDVMTFSWNDDEKDSIRFVYHVEAESRDAEPADDLAEVEWVKPRELAEKLDTLDAERIKERPRQRKFMEAFK